MKHFKIYSLYAILYTLLAIFSYGFVDANSPFKTWLTLYRLVHFQRGLATTIYIILVTALFALYGWVLWLVKKEKIGVKQIWYLIGLSVVILLFSFPGFSYDIFNYMATARVTFLYQENPYLVMPIEISNEPMLAFMHAANKTALYGPFWILLTSMPHFAGLGHLFLTIFTFKGLIIIFYLSLVWLIWHLSNKNTWSLAFFALNPLVIVQTLVSGHNDVVMMVFALLAFYFLKKRKFCLAFFSLTLSFLIKFATIFLLPVFIYAFLSRPKIDWSKIWRYGFYSMLFIFLLSPLREEIYSWYFIWPLTFIAFLPEWYSAAVVSSAFSFGLIFRIAPFLYTRSWSGITPTIKEIVSFLPPTLALAYFKFKRFILN